MFDAPSDGWVYAPPIAAENARRILVKPNLGYPAPPPVTVSMPILKAVLDGLRCVSPRAEILIVEGVCSPVSAEEIFRQRGLLDILDDNMRALDADSLPMAEYLNRSDNPVKYDKMTAPKLLEEVDCRISIGALKRTTLKGQPLISASLKNLYGLFPREKYHARSPHARGQLHRPGVPQVLTDVYFCIGHLFDGGVVDATQKFVSRDWKPDKGKAIPIGRVVWGDDLLAVDVRACQVGDETVPDYVDAIRAITQS